MWIMKRAWMVLAVVILSCGDDGNEVNPFGECRYQSQESPHVPVDELTEHAFRRESCEFKRGDPVDRSLGFVPQIPPTLKHVIVLMRENRSYDHFLGAYRPLEKPQEPPLLPDDEVSNPDPSGEMRNAPISRFHEKEYCTANPAHHWADVRLQFNNGQLDGFVAASNRGDRNEGGCVAMGYYDVTDIPLYYWLADNFSISQNYHASILGPTMPNIMFYYFATSCGTTDNVEATVFHCPEEQQSIFELLEGKATFAIYSDSTPKSFGAAVRLTERTATTVRSISAFEDDLAAGTLPEVVFVEPNYGHSHIGTQNDEHPPSNVQDGQVFVYRITNALMNSSSWSSSIMFITWDEHGGYYDHVVPPTACEPEPRSMPDFDFKHLGFRTPFFAVSPFARKGYVSRYTSDHTSILRFIEAWKGLGALTSRDANAWPLLDMFDFGATPNDPGPPSAFLAIKSTSPEHIAQCADLDHVSSSCAR